MGNKSLMFIVLGMHRSGTSAVAGTLHHLGIHMGDTLLGATASNPKGHYESIPFVRLNNAILKQAGGSWRKAPSRKQIERYGFSTEALKNFLEKEKKPNWGLKDPRTLLTLPLWKPHVEQIAQVYYVFVYRDFDDVVRSLARRDEISMRRAERILIPYLKNLHYYRHVAGLHEMRLIDVQYEHLLRDPSYYVALVNHILGRDETHGQDDVQHYLDARLNHQGSYVKSYKMT